jgi:hypothetical protein
VVDADQVQAQVDLRGYSGRGEDVRLLYRHSIAVRWLTDAPRLTSHPGLWHPNDGDHEATS